MFGGMSPECSMFYKRLSKMIADKRNININIATNLIRTKLSFSLLRMCLLCIRGSRSIKKDVSNNITDLAHTDFDLAISEARL